MKIKFLGTSAGWPLPRLGCKCEICTSKNPKDIRTRTQILVNDSILLDAGPDTYNHLINLDSSPAKPDQNDRGVWHIKAVLISHAHLDHIMGFWDLTHIYNGYKPIDIYITQQVLYEIRKYISIHGQNLKINIVKPNRSFMINHTKVEYIPIIHGKTPAYAIKVKDNKIFTYIPDFNRILPSQQKTVKYNHLLALDGSSLDKIGQTSGHISIKDGIQIAKELKVKKTYFIHIGHKTGTHDSLEKYLEENAGKNFHIAYDGLEINI